MLQELFNLVSQHAQDAIVNNSAVPNEHNDAAIQSVTDAIQSGLQGQAGSNLSDLVGMIQNGNLAQSPMVQNIINSAAGSLADKFGVDSNQAASIASSLIPQVMSSFASQTTDPGNSTFDLNNVISSLTGGANSGGGGGIGSLLGGLLK